MYAWHAYEMVTEQFRDKEVDQVTHRCNVDHNLCQCLQDYLSFRLILLQQLIIYYKEKWIVETIISNV